EKNASYLCLLADVYAAAGRTEEARKIISKMEQEAKRTYIYSVAFAVPYAIMGDTDRALEWLEKKLQAPGTGLTALKVDPTWDRLRSDPRFQDLLLRAGFRP